MGNHGHDFPSFYVFARVGKTFLWTDNSLEVGILVPKELEWQDTILILETYPHSKSTWRNTLTKSPDPEIRPSLSIKAQLLATRAHARGERCRGPQRDVFTPPAETQEVLSPASRSRCSRRVGDRSGETAKKGPTQRPANEVEGFFLQG